MEKSGILILLVSFIVLGALPLMARGLSWWSSVFPSETYLSSVFEGQAKSLASQVEIPANADFYEKVDAIRNFVWMNSLHKIDKEFYTYWHDVPRLMAMISARAEDPETKAPHMECSTRSAVMYWLLKAAGVRSRIVVIYPSGRPVEGSHTFLEVFNPERQKWEIQDPDYNSYWVFKQSGERASIEDLLAYPVEEMFLPCRSDDDCSHNKRTKKLPEKFDLAYLINLDEQDHPLLLNPSRFDPQDPFIKKIPAQQYCALFKDDCVQRIITISDKTD